MTEFQSGPYIGYTDSRIVPQSFLVLAFCDQNMGFYLKCTPIGQIVGSANVDGREMNNKVKAPSTLEFAGPLKFKV